MKLIISVLMLCFATAVYAACRVTYTQYTVNGQIVSCECLVCDNGISDCYCK
jgi:hypothetical protein